MKPRDSEWIHLYQAGMSTTRIAKQYDVGASTVGRHLRRHISLRNRMEACILASTKYDKHPFSGDVLERAYLCGYVEDCHIRKEGRQIEVSTTTTHPDVGALFRSGFERYGHITKLASFDILHCCYRYQFSTLLEAGLESVLDKSPTLPGTIPRDSIGPSLTSYLAGLIDAEGVISLYNNNGRADCVLYITTNKYRLLRCLRGILGGRLHRHERAWRLKFCGKSAVRLLEQLPLRHREKVTRSLVVQSATGRPWEQVCDKWFGIIEGIHEDVSQYKQAAMREYIRVHGRAHTKDIRSGV